MIRRESEKKNFRKKKKFSLSCEKTVQESEKNACQNRPPLGNFGMPLESLEALGGTLIFRGPLTAVLPAKFAPLLAILAGLL